MASKTVFVFGAGASHGWSLEPASAPPVSSGFFAAARASLWLKQVHIERSWPCFAALKTLYGLPNGLTPLRLLKEGHYDDINLEDAATRLFRKWLDNKSASNLRAYRNFKLLIARVIGKALEEMGRRTCEYHQDIVLTHARASDTIVTFNYDWILESALQRKYESWGQPWDYSFPGSPDGGWRKNKRPRVLKPHGSLDWQLHAGTIQIANREVMLSAILDHRTNPDRIVIVPPVLLKEEETSSQPPAVQAHFNHIWKQLESAISKATRIIFIGYSLPRGDTKAYRTILAAASRRRCQIHLVNPDGARLRDELSMIFGKNNVAWDFTTVSAYSRAKRQE